jgi:hypothetical protein
MPLVGSGYRGGALQTLEYLDSIRENRTGYTKTAEGMKSSSLATETLGRAADAAEPVRDQAGDDC